MKRIYTAYTIYTPLVFALAAFPAIAFGQLGDPGNAVSRPDIEVVINGRRVDFTDGAPAKQSGRILVPLRDVLRSLPAVALAWDPSNQTVSAAYMDRVVKLRIGSRDAKVNGRTEELDAPATTMDGRTMVPLRFLSEALGAVVTWSSGDQRVTISMPINAPAGSIASTDTTTTTTQNGPILAARQTRRFFRTAQNSKKLTTRGVRFKPAPQMTDTQLLTALEQQVDTDYSNWAADREKAASDYNSYSMWANLQLTFNTMKVYNGSYGYNGMPRNGLVPLDPAGWAQWQATLKSDAEQVTYDLQALTTDYSAYVKVFRRVHPNETPLPKPSVSKALSIEH